MADGSSTSGCAGVCAVAHLVAELLAEVRALRIDLAEQRTGADVRLALLLRAAEATVGERAFDAQELVALSADTLSTRIALRHAIEAVAGRAEHRSKSIGRFLSKHAGQSAEGLRLVAVGRAVYRISRIERGEIGPWHHRSDGSKERR